jgi:3-oxoacyl-[acyl-carrier protein] reductase
MIVVTGASRGLGRAIGERLLARGEQVCGLARTASELPFPTMRCDVASCDQVKGAAAEIKRAGSSVRALINAAGIASMNLALTTPPRIAREIIETNLLGTIHCCQSFAPLIIRNKPGTIINFSTIAVPLGLKGESVYVASKAGVEGFSRVFAREMADFDITVNCIAPGPIDTDLIKGVGAGQISRIVQQQVLPRQFSPDAICDLVELLLDPRSRSLSGQVFHVGGA